MDMSVEEHARQLGWVPKEEFRGPEGQWKDAETFVRDGEQILPVVRANNKKLVAELSETKSQVLELKKLVEAGNDSLKAFEEFHQQSLADALERQRKELTAEMRAARENGDVDLEENLRDQIDEVRQQQRDLKNKPAKTEVKTETKPADTAPQVDPEFLMWNTQNPWFGKDKKLTAFANGMATTMRQDPENSHLVGRAFYDAVAQQVKAAFPDDFPEAPSHDKMEGARGPSRRSGGRSYNDLPADAKAACDRFGQRLAGPGRAYKDLDAWRTQYAKEFFGE